MDLSQSDVLSEKQKNELKKQYEELKGFYEKLVDEILYVLRDCISKDKTKVHSLTCRETKIKTFSSFCSKVIRKSISKNHFDIVEDIAAVRVICLYRPDLERLGNIIQESFDVLRIDTSRTRAEKPFGYAGDHYIVKLSKEFKGSRYDDIKNLKCEIQVRTILMDAWDSVSHHLDYKQELDIPIELRADFNALSGLFYVADTHFRLFKEGVQETRASLMKTVQQDTFNLDQATNLDSLTAYMKYKFPKKTIGDVTSAVLQELRHFGYDSIRELDRKFDIALPSMMKMESEMLESGLLPARLRWTPAGLISNCLDLTDDKYYSSRKGEFPPDLEALKGKYRDRVRKRAL